jgi:hypothetical protein
MQDKSVSLKDKDFLESGDPIKDLVGLICIVVENNQAFSARLIAADDKTAWFKNKYGRVWMISRDGITSIRPTKNQTPDPNPGRVV